MFAYGVAYGYQLQTGPGTYNESAFKNMDFVIAEAGKRDLKLLISLASNWIYAPNTTGTKYPPPSPSNLSPVACCSWVSGPEKVMVRTSSPLIVASSPPPISNDVAFTPA